MFSFGAQLGVPFIFGADAKPPLDEASKALIAAACKANDVAALKAVIDPFTAAGKYNIHEPVDGTYNPMHTAAIAGAGDVMAYLVETFPDCDADRFNGTETTSLKLLMQRCGPKPATEPTSPDLSQLNVTDDEKRTIELMTMRFEAEVKREVASGTAPEEARAIAGKRLVLKPALGFMNKYTCCPPLFEAIKLGRVAFVKCLYEVFGAAAAIATLHEQLQPQLLQSAMMGHQPIGLGNFIPAGGTNVPLPAAEHCMDVLRYLLTLKLYPVNVASSNFHPGDPAPLDAAVLTGLEATRLIVEAYRSETDTMAAEEGANDKPPQRLLPVDLKTPASFAAFCKAARRGNVEILKYLSSEAGMDICAVAEDKFTTLMGAACEGGALNVVQFFIKEMKVRPDGIHNPLQWTNVHACALASQNTVLKHLIEEGAAINGRVNRVFSDTLAWRVKSGATPLHCAALSANAEAVSMLIAAGCDIHAKDEEGHTPLDYATEENRKGSHKKVLALLRRGGK